MFRYWRSMSRRSRLVIITLATTLPTAVASLDIFGYVAKVEGSSMQPCLNNEPGVSDWVFLNRWLARDFKIERGELVVLHSPRNPDEKFIKRIIALEGDRLKTLTNGEQCVTIPRGHCWVEGDNHRVSRDSNKFGPVPLGLVYAKATHVVWPPSHWKPLETIPVSNRLRTPSQSSESVEHLQERTSQLSASVKLAGDIDDIVCKDDCLKQPNLER